MNRKADNSNIIHVYAGQNDHALKLINYLFRQNYKPLPNPSDSACVSLQGNDGLIVKIM